MINLDGRDVRLTLVKSTEPRTERKGTRSKRVYRGNSVRVVIKYVVTGLCPPNDESCEVTNYDAVIAVKTHSGSERVRAHGICGS